MAKDCTARSSSSSRLSLSQEADIIYPYICQISEYYDKNLISSPDYVGLYILIYISIRRPNAWSNGKLNRPIYEPIPPLSQQIKEFSSKLSNYPDIMRLMGGESYLTRKLNVSIESEEYLNVTVISIFNRLQFTGIKKNKDHFINRSIVYWALSSYYQPSYIKLSNNQHILLTIENNTTCNTHNNTYHNHNNNENNDTYNHNNEYNQYNQYNENESYHRPFQLMFTIPSPLQVLRQQANGQRVVTLFRTLSELSSTHKAMLYYMDGMQNHEKDALEFLLHDLIHMEHFMNLSIYQEQIGFFRCMLQLENGYPKRFFITKHGYDEQLWRELEYVISDMNCHVPHLMSYLLAKMRLASSRCCDKSNSSGNSSDSNESHSSNSDKSNTGNGSHCNDSNSNATISNDSNGNDSNGSGVSGSSGNSSNNMGNHCSNDKDSNDSKTNSEGFSYCATSTITATSTTTATSATTATTTTATSATRNNNNNIDLHIRDGEEVMMMETDNPIHTTSLSKSNSSTSDMTTQSPILSYTHTNSNSTSSVLPTSIPVSVSVQTQQNVPRQHLQTAWSDLLQQFGMKMPEYELSPCSSSNSGSSSSSSSIANNNSSNNNNNSSSSSSGSSSSSIANNNNNNNNSSSSNNTNTTSNNSTDANLDIDSRRNCEGMTETEDVRFNDSINHSIGLSSSSAVAATDTPSSSVADTSSSPATATDASSSSSPAAATDVSSSSSAATATDTSSSPATATATDASSLSSAVAATESSSSSAVAATDTSSSSVADTSSTSPSSELLQQPILQTVYEIAYGMIDSSYRERASMSAEEGEILREFFRQKSKSKNEFS